MRRPLAVLAAAAFLLSGCSSAEDDVAAIAGPEWTVTDIYLDPGELSTLPPTVAGSVSLAFGASSAVGATGCAPLQASVTFFAGGEPAAAEDADRVVFDAVEVDDAPCEGDARGVHDRMTSLIEPGAEFDLERRGPTELVLTKDTPEIDSPSLRLIAV